MLLVQIVVPPTRQPIVAMCQNANTRAREANSHFVRIADLCGLLINPTYRPKSSHRLSNDFEYTA